jgi:hypothetical protein
MLSAVLQLLHSELWSWRLQLPCHWQYGCCFRVPHCHGYKDDTYQSLSGSRVAGTVCICCSIGVTARHLYMPVDADGAVCYSAKCDLQRTNSIDGTDLVCCFQMCWSAFLSSRARQSTNRQTVLCSYFYECCQHVIKQLLLLYADV